MTPYARMLLQYLHASVAARRRVEAFVFGTRLTRITNELGGRDHDRALERAAAAVSDFSGGTRIGSALAELNRDPRPAGRPRRSDRRAVRRLGSRRPGRARGRDGTAAPKRPPAGVAEPAGRPPRLRTADPRACARRFRTPTRSWPATRWPRSRSSPRPWRRSEMKDVLPEITKWEARGDRIALATVVGVQRSAPRAPGAKMAVNENGEIAGGRVGGMRRGGGGGDRRAGDGRGGAAARALRDRGLRCVGRGAAVRRGDRRVGAAATSPAPDSRSWRGKADAGPR